MDEMNELYYQDPYRTEFDASVVSCEPLKQGYGIVLTQTVFYPEGGGQPGDTGTLNGIRVFDTHRKNDSILHYSTEPIEPGTQVHGMIDWDRRFDLMQQHSGEHIFSGLIHQLFGYENIGFHLGEETVTLDFSGILSENDLARTEWRANEIIWKNEPAQITFPSAEELKTLPYRSKKELEGAVRIVTFPDADVCACCGTHVHRAGEIGLIKVLSSQNRRQGTRVDIVCGARALNYIRSTYDQNMKISHLLSAPVLDTSSAVERTLNELGSLRAEIHAYCMQALAEHAEQVRSGQPLAVIFTKEIDSRDLRTFCNQLIEEKQVGICAAFSEHNDAWQYVILSTAKDLRPIGKLLNERFHGRGGGQAVMIQGSLTGSETEIRKFLQDITEE